MTSFFIDSNGYLFGCGSNEKGQLAIGTLEIKTLNTFRQISDHKFKSVSASEYHAMAIDEDGNLWSSGRNDFGQLGLGDCEDRNILTKISINKQFVMVSCGHCHSIAIDEDGFLWACGHNLQGQLGLGDNDKRNNFEQISTNERFRIISCGNFHTMAIDENGYTRLGRACGDNDVGQLGFCDYKNRNEFEKVLCDNQFVMVSCGTNHTMAINEEGSLWACGCNDYGQLGLSDYEDRNKLEKVSIEGQFVMVICGLDHTMVIDGEGYLWGCGANICSQLGFFCYYKDINKFKKAPTDKRFIMISCGGWHTMGADEYGCLYACGNNEFGQLGFHDNEDRTRFEKIETTSETQTLMNTCFLKKRGSNTKGAHMTQEL